MKNSALILAVVIIAGLVWYIMSSSPAQAPTTSEIKTDTPTPTTPTKTVKSTPTAVTPSTTTSGAGSRIYDKGQWVTLIYLTNSGFSPAQLEIKAGEEVRFVNKTSLTMRVVSDDKLSNSFYAYFNQAQSVGKGGTYQLSLMQPGIFIYYNLNSDPRVSGQIIVK